MLVTMNARLLAVGGSVMDLGLRHHSQSFPGPTLQSFFSQVLSSAENIAVGLAIEKACSWLSANITGKTQAKGAADPSFQKWTGRKLEAIWGKRDSEPAGNSKGHG